MKQKLLLLIAVIAFLLPARLSAFEYGGLNYSPIWDYDENGNWINTGGVKVAQFTEDNLYAGDIVIPSSIEYDGETWSVVAIGHAAFIHCTELTSIVIPKTVTTIEAYAFQNCSSLTSIEIPNSVTSIGNGAFKDCNNLLFFVIESNNVNFRGDVFGTNGYKPRYVFAPEGLDCSALNCDVRTFDSDSAILLEDYTILTDNEKTLFFAPIYAGSDYAIPEGVTKILSNSFFPMNSADANLSSLTIPSTIEEIEADVFLNTRIDKVNFTDWSKWYGNVKLENLYSNPYWNSTPYVGGVKMETPELTEGMTQIPDYINCGLQFKDEIELPRSIKRIGAYAFYHNRELYSVILPAGLEEIGECAFAGCELLENPSFPSGLKTIDNGAYAGCRSITEIELPKGLTTLGKMNPQKPNQEWANSNHGYDPGVFAGCTSLEKAIVVCDIDYLDDNLFHGCQKLTKVFLPLQLKTIGAYAFAMCPSYDEVTLPATLETIGEFAFACRIDDEYDPTGPTPPTGSISKMVISDNVKTIGRQAFQYQNIRNLTIGKGLDEIQSGTFLGNPLQIINFSEGLKKIGHSAFAYGRSVLGSVMLPSSVTEIETAAFNNTNMAELYIPDGVTSITGYNTCGIPSKLTLGSGIKELDPSTINFENLYTFRVKAHMPPSLSDALPLTEEINDQLTLIVNRGRHDTYNTNARWKQIDRIIEDGDSEVTIYLDGTYTLAEEIRIQSGYMPSVITKMKVNGPLSATDLRVIKENMVALTSLDLSDVTNVTALPENQFAGSLITDIVLPAKLETIGDGAFNECRLLTLTELPASVNSIGNYAFASCPGVNIASMPASLERIGYSAFSYSGMREFVAGELISEIGSDAFSYCTLLERADLSASSITRIEGNLFGGCSELDEVMLPSSVEAIGYSAFSGTALRNIDFASEVASIGDNAFSNNRRLVTATLPETLTTVGSNLFQNCPRLISVSMPASTTNVGTEVLSGDRKLANLSCAAVEAPDAQTGAFNDVRYRYVTLTIPTLSFRKYLTAPQWGKFENMKNTIQVSVGEGVNVTNAAETEYQDMLEEDALEEAQEAAAQENGEITRARAMRRAAARAKSVQRFASLFDGAQLMSGSEGSANRVFITPEPGVKVTSIMLDDQELLPAFDGYSLLLPEGCTGNLKIITDGKSNDDSNVVEETMTIDPNALVDVYNMNGILVKRACPSEDLNQLTPGMYILRSGNKTVKTLIH